MTIYSLSPPFYVLTKKLQPLKHILRIHILSHIRNISKGLYLHPAGSIAALHIDPVRLSLFAQAHPTVFLIQPICEFQIPRLDHITSLSPAKPYMIYAFRQQFLRGLLHRRLIRLSLAVRRLSVRLPVLHCIGRLYPDCLRLRYGISPHPLHIITSYLYAADSDLFYHKFTVITIDTSVFFWMSFNKIGRLTNRKLCLWANSFRHSLLQFLSFT